jgi:hypothetical protein
MWEGRIARSVQTSGLARIFASPDRKTGRPQRRPDQPTASRQRAERIGEESDVRCGGELDTAVRRVRL